MQRNLVWVAGGRLAVANTAGKISATSDGRWIEKQMAFFQLSFIIVYPSQPGSRCTVFHSRPAG